SQAFHGYRPVADAVHIEEVCFRAERQEQMIKLEFKFAVRNATRAMNSPRVEINRLNVGLNKLHMTKNASERIHDVARIKISCRDLVQHRRKQNEILSTD